MQSENIVTTGWQRMISNFIFLLRTEAGSVFFILVFSQRLQFWFKKDLRPKSYIILGDSFLSCSCHRETLGYYSDTDIFEAKNVHWQ